MQGFKHSVERSSHDVPTTQPSGAPYGRTLSNRRYLRTRPSATVERPAGAALSLHRGGSDCGGISLSTDLGVRRNIADPVRADF